MPYVLPLVGQITGLAIGTGMSSFAADNGL